MGPELISRIVRGTTDAYLLERTQVLFIDEVSFWEQIVMQKFDYIDLFCSTSTTTTTTNNNNDNTLLTAAVTTAANYGDGKNTKRLQQQQ